MNVKLEGRIEIDVTGACYLEIVAKKHEVEMINKGTYSVLSRFRLTDDFLDMKKGRQNSLIRKTYLFYVARLVHNSCLVNHERGT